MPYKTALFDLDGTLTDSAPGIVNSTKYAFEKFGEECPSEEFIRQHFIGPPLEASFRKHCGWDAEKAWQGVLCYREYFNVKGYLENSLYPGVAELLERLKAAGIRLAVATSKPEEFAVKILEHFGVDKYFDFIGGATPDGSRVHKNDVIFYVLENLGNPDKGDVVMVGDKENDVFGARDAGMPCIGVLYGYGGREELESAGADFIAADCDGIFDIICK